MTTNPSVDFLTRTVREKHTMLIESAASLLKILASDDPAAKKRSVGETGRNVLSLMSLLSHQDVPTWLTQLNAICGNYEANAISSPEFLINFIPAKAGLDAHQWSFEGPQSDAFDFDSVFERYRNESRIPELFDKIISLLEEIESSGYVDSLIVLRGLSRVIATMKRCKDGSYFSLQGAWEFLLNFLGNYIWGELVKVPMLGTALEALAKTIKEADAEMATLHSNIQTDLVCSVSAAVPQLANKSSFPFVGYSRDGLALPEPPRQQLPNLSA